MSIRSTGYSKTIKSDARVLKFRKTVAILRKNSVDCDKLIEQMQAMHVTRKERRAKMSQVVEQAQRDLVDMTLRNQALRSRVIEIKMKVYVVVSEMEDYLGAITDYILANYPTELESLAGSKTKADRVSYINSLLETERRFYKKLQLVIKIADTLIDDIDKAAWAVKSVTDVIAITGGKASHV